MSRIATTVLALVMSASGTACMVGDSPASGAGSTPIPAFNGPAVYVVNGQDHSIAVVDPGRNALVGTIVLSGITWPHHIYLSKDGSRMVVAVPNMDLSGGHGASMDMNPGAVLLLESSTGRTIASRALEMMNHNAIFSPDGTEIWTSQMMMPGSVLVLDSQTLATKQTIDVGDMPAEVTFSKDGTMAFVANGMSDSVSVISVATKKVMKTIPVGKDPVGPWPGTDGIMYTDCEQGKSISAIDPASMAVVRTYNLGFTPGMVGTPPGAGGELWVTDEDDGKVVFNMTTQDKKMGELLVGAGAHGVTFAPDGKTAYITNQTGGTMTIVDVASHALIKTMAVGAKPNGIAYRAL